ncbi:glycosyltransferase family 9 protein [Tuwongella immobilis]|uniref:Glycosyltransferase family 9 protein n=1 Tax=Tuwongella immobilis TaxID=692036 RepID=A0A6C2YJ51_9BACT|nr:glycosyltransferase family 9 protein [Tuwongella immobilis]VIP01269.1 lipopolysaccharide heptosyltransferase ii : ADP-heptose:LPS heptosyltransferase OS=Singulisphaera acidiphila (strain ATCC BAA-1392 / DSM 18658 / VKM B-2454 / MOB10) GN=Sinac_1554 PE=4 SV=1: Glyco_transf_9 [Tuwongella immobilis]VTR97964.1 lipopolysaccharide heptosyltransferase ii : ADP-heptose:LPS heptosyltransferase OS=Singulisphaera acidiphila (strain ATCC BAA-1392 / DSM 18658 / VKM B-2454 / MOB10) GN=Sinac_1554 PE=4 SV=1: 
MLSSIGSPTRLPLTAIEPRRIGLLKPSALGDIIHALPVLGALRDRFPTAHITWVVNRAYIPLLQGNPDLNDILPFDRSMGKGNLNRLVTSALNFASQLRRRRFDLVIDLQGLLRTGLMCLFSGARRRIGLHSSREGAHLAYTDWLPVPDPNMHAVDRYWLVAEALGAGHFAKRFPIPIAPEAHRWAESALANLPRPWMMVAPGARWLTKRWPPEHFAELLQRAQQRFGGSACFVGVGEDATIAAKAMAKLDGPTQDWCGRTNLPQLAALLSRADVVLANDTGPLHLAAALGRPIIAPYTCTQIRRHGPYGYDRGPVESAVWCQGSYVKSCNRMECMDDLKPDRLWFFLHEALASWARHSRSA